MPSSWVLPSPLTRANPVTRYLTKTSKVIAQGWRAKNLNAPKPKKPCIMYSPARCTNPEMRKAVWSLSRPRKLKGREPNRNSRGRRRIVWRIKSATPSKGCVEVVCQQTIVFVEMRSSDLPIATSDAKHSYGCSENEGLNGIYSPPKILYTVHIGETAKQGWPVRGLRNSCCNKDNACHAMKCIDTCVCWDS